MSFPTHHIPVCSAALLALLLAAPAHAQIGVPDLDGDGTSETTLSLLDETIEVTVGGEGGIDTTGGTLPEIEGGLGLAVNDVSVVVESPGNTAAPTPGAAPTPPTAAPANPTQPGSATAPAAGAAPATAVSSGAPGGDPCSAEWLTAEAIAALAVPRSIAVVEHCAGSATLATDRAAALGGNRALHTALEHAGIPLPRIVGLAMAGGGILSVYLD